MDEPMGTPDSNDRGNPISERGSWDHFVALALILGTVGIAISLLMAHSYYTGVLEGLRMLPVTEVHHE